MTTPTKEQIRKIADGIYCCLPDDDLLQVVEHSIREWEKIKEFFGIVAETNLTTPRACLSAFLRSLEKCDVNVRCLAVF